MLHRGAGRDKGLTRERTVRYRFSCATPRQEDKRVFRENSKLDSPQLGLFGMNQTMEDNPALRRHVSSESVVLLLLRNRIIARKQTIASTRGDCYTYGLLSRSTEPEPEDLDRLNLKQRNYFPFVPSSAAFNTVLRRFLVTFH